MLPQTEKFVFENTHLKVEEYYILHGARAVLEIPKIPTAELIFSSSVLEKMSLTEDTIYIKLLPQKFSHKLSC